MGGPVGWSLGSSYPVSHRGTNSSSIWPLDGLQPPKVKVAADDAAIGGGGSGEGSSAGAGVAVGGPPAGGGAPVAGVGVGLGMAAGVGVGLLMEAGVGVWLAMAAGVGVDVDVGVLKVKVALAETLSGGPETGSGHGPDVTVSWMLCPALPMIVKVPDRPNRVIDTDPDAPLIVCGPLGIAPAGHVQPSPLSVPLTEGASPEDGFKSSVATTLEAPDAGTSPRATMVTRRRKMGRVGCRMDSPA